MSGEQHSVAVLDNGYLTIVETWGSDKRIIEAARMSTDKGFLGWGTDERPGDEKLLAYLWKHKHSTPFEMAGAIIEVQAPIMVFREWMRHRTQSYSELSARYTQMPNLHYLPDPERVRAQSKANKQGTAATALDPTVVDEFLRRIAQEQAYIYETYAWALEHGISREVARLNTPVSRYSRMRASANLLNWLRFLSLRQAPGAQEEIRRYANALATGLRSAFPRTMACFDTTGGI